MAVIGTPELNDLDGWLNTFGNIIYMENIISDIKDQI